MPAQVGLKCLPGAVEHCHVSLGGPHRCCPTFCRAECRTAFVGFEMTDSPKPADPPSGSRPAGTPIVMFSTPASPPPCCVDLPVPANPDRPFFFAPFASLFPFPPPRKPSWRVFPERDMPNAHCTVYGSQPPHPHSTSRSDAPRTRWCLGALCWCPAPLHNKVQRRNQIVIRLKATPPKGWQLPCREPCHRQRSVPTAPKVVVAGCAGVCCHSSLQKF